MNDLDHPCRDTCSGWKQGYEKGAKTERERALRVFDGWRKHWLLKEGDGYFQRAVKIDANMRRDFERRVTDAND